MRRCKKGDWKSRLCPECGLDFILQLVVRVRHGSFCEKDARIFNNSTKDWSDLRRKSSDTESKEGAPATLDL